LPLDALPPRIEEQLLDIWYYDYAVAVNEFSETGRPGFHLAQTFEAAVYAKVAGGGGVIYRLRWNPKWDRISWQKVPPREYKRIEEEIRSKVQTVE